MDSDLFIVPVHRWSKTEYDRRRQQRADDLWVAIEEGYRSLGRVAPEDKRNWLDIRHPPAPWEFNELAGFLRIRIIGSFGLTGQLFLKRKFLPRHDARWSWGRRVLERQEILYYQTLPDERVDPNAQHTIRDGIERVMSSARRVLRARNRGFTLGATPVSLEHVDLVQWLARKAAA